MITQLEAARQLIRRGRSIVPVPLGSKAPTLKNWTDLRFTEADLEPHFTTPCNLGLLLGKPSGWVVDIDLDTSEAVRAAPFFFPPTYTYGRESRPGSHLLVICKGAKTQKYKFKDQLLLEVRSTGAQSLIPPSQHPCGDLYRIERHNRTAATISLDELYLAAERTAAAALFAGYWPGARHHKALALSGALLHAGWDGDDAVEFVECVAQAALDNELEDRSRAAQASVKRFAQGEHTTGWPVLLAHFDEAVIVQVRSWLNIIDEPRLNGVTSAKRTQGVDRNTPDKIDAESWPEPQPLIAAKDLAPYPMNALPKGIGVAVREVVDFMQCPVSLAACSALSALSLACQGLADVRRADKLSGPCSLYLLAIADSGERKTSCDNFFTASIREWERQQIERMEPELLSHTAAMRAWTAKREGVSQAIKQAAKSGKSAFEKERELERLEANKPQAPRVPSLIYSDTTPEALAFNLARSWPSGGVLSSEAGIVFGGHAMGGDSIMRNLALLNRLWDGIRHRVHRRTSESFTVDGVRLTIGLAAQPLTVRTFFEQSKGLARGTGFGARFLIAWPQSTQGDRPFKDPPESWPRLTKFHDRTRVLLDQTPDANELGELELPTLNLSAKAKAAWVQFHDEVEQELKPGGDMTETRDVASKAADNAARLAALFHIFEHGTSGEISAAHVHAATPIITWYLYEARRFLSEVAAPPVMGNALRLDAWLIQHCREHQVSAMNTRHVLQYGPGLLRHKNALEEAIAELTDAGRARPVQDGQQRKIEVNPALLGNEHGAA